MTIAARTIETLQQIADNTAHLIGTEGFDLSNQYETSRLNHLANLGYVTLTGNINAMAGGACVTQSGLDFLNKQEG